MNANTPPKGDILIVDDNPVNLDLLSGMLLDRGYRVRVATNGRRALSAARSAIPDLVMLDINMPEMDGYEVCKQLKGEQVTADIPVIFISALDNALDKVKAFLTGGADYVTKPFQFEEVLARIEIQLKISRLQKEMERKNSELEQSNVHLERANRMLRTLSYLDGLTGIANRRHFEESFDQEWRRAARVGTALSLLMVDIDLFKSLNDAKGHQYGDDCLRQVAGTLSDTLRRAGDLVARYGGEEFAVVLPGSDTDGAVAIAEEIRARVEALGVKHEQSPCGVVTVSLGVATAFPIDGDSPASLIDAADRALYQAKHDGRNRLVTAASDRASASDQSPIDV
ncbi:MAG TPA: PleD family two-component system response regulator [Blastocatellia bacterium]|nr:PleD family two-component system response regulator [Blastocatellia bacterium]